MEDAHKSKSQLIQELAELRQRIAALELAEAEYKQVEARLLDKNKRLSSMIEQSTEPLFCYECIPPISTNLPIEQQVESAYNSILVECNEACARSYGASRPEEVIGKRITELMETQSGRLDALFHAIVEGGYRIIDGETVRIPEDGKKRYTLNNAYGVVENGMLLRVWGTFRDVTERKEVEQQLTILSSVVDQSEESIVIIALDGTILYANPTFFRRSELDPETIIGHKWRTFLASDASLREKYPEIRDTVINQGRLWSGEVVDRVPSGELVWRELKLFPIKNAKGEISHTVYASNNITPRKKAEIALRESERKYRLLIEHIPTVVWISTQAGETVFISENVEDVYGFSVNEILAGGEALWFGRIHPDDHKRVQDALERLFSTGMEFRIEYRIQRKDGQWIWILDRANLVQEVGGRRLAYGVFSDISESKQFEQALQLYIDRLKILYQINQGILIAQSPGEIAQVALRWIRQLIPCYRAGVVLFDLVSHQGKLIALDIEGKTELTAGTSMPLDQYYDYVNLRDPLTHGQTVVREHQPVDTLSKIMYAEGIRTIAYVPLVYEGELIGSLNLSWLESYQLTGVQEDIAREVAAQLSIAIRQIQLRESDNRRRKELEILEHVSTALRYAEKLEEVYTILINEFKALFSVDAVAILLPQNGRMECASVYGSEQLKDQLCNQEGIILELSPILLLGETKFEPQHGFGLQDIASTALLPFQSQETLLGGAILFWKELHEFSEEERRLLNTVADVAGIALHRMKVLETLEQQIEDRTRALSALYEVTAVSSRSLDLQKIIDQSLVKMLAAMKCEIGIIHLLDDTGSTLQMVSCQGIDPQIVEAVKSLPKELILIKEVLEQRKALVIPDLSTDPRAPELARQAVGFPYVGIPIRARDRVLGVLTVVGPAGSSYGEEAVSLLNSIADQIGIAIENARLYEQAQQLAVLAERARVARDLHDSVTQSLYSLNLMAGTGRRLLESGNDKEKIAHTFDRLGTTAHQALKEMRLLLYEMRPSVLEREGLVGALRRRLEAVEGRAEIKTHLHTEDLPKLPPLVEAGLYHIAQEALNNALKHADSTQVDVNMRRQNDWIELEICDDGKGFALEEKDQNQGMGLASMRERAKILGAELQITSRPGTGTCVSVRVKVT